MRNTSKLIRCLKAELRTRQNGLTLKHRLNIVRAFSIFNGRLFSRA